MTLSTRTHWCRSSSEPKTTPSPAECFQQQRHSVNLDRKIGTKRMPSFFANNRQVTLISGGGSGHEPAFAGYVGQGLLTAAVCGGVFASPSASAVLEAIRAACGPLGCLVLVMNYTGDRYRRAKPGRKPLGQHQGTAASSGSFRRPFCRTCVSMALANPKHPPGRQSRHTAGGRCSKAQAVAVSRSVIRQFPLLSPPSLRPSRRQAGLTLAWRWSVPRRRD